MFKREHLLLSKQARRAHAIRPEHIPVSGACPSQSLSPVIITLANPHSAMSRRAAGFRYF
jgi:hypothetical protein